MIQLDRDALQPGGIERLARSVIGGVLDEDALAGVEQHTRAQCQRLLRAGQDQNPVGRGMSPALEVHIIGDRPSQRLDALRGAMQQRRRAGLLEHLPLQAFPEPEGKAARLRYPGREGPR